MKESVEGPSGPLEVLQTGTDEPVTLFAHGLASSIDETRPFGSGVRGTRVYMHLRGHGDSASPAGAWTYAGLAAEVAAVAEHAGARQALGISLGAGAILRLALDEPASFDRIVLVLPGAFDRPRSDGGVRHLERIASLVGAGDVDALAAALVAEQPLGARGRDDVAVWATRRAQQLSRAPVAAGLRDLMPDHPVPAGADLGSITCPVLVVGQLGDATHPAELIGEIAARLPNATARVFDAEGLLWAHRAELRSLVSAFLSPGSG